MRGILVSLLSLFVVVLHACGDGGMATTTTPGPSLPDDPAELMATALLTTFRDVTATVDSPPDPSAAVKMGQSGDQRYIPVLVDMAGLPWLLDEPTEAAIFESLSALSGAVLTDENRNWTWWVEWLSGRDDIPLHDGYALWKGNLFTAYVDSRIGSFLVDAEDPRVRIEEVVWGGVVRDGIPDLQDPPIVVADEAAYLNADDRVFGLTIGGESRAYPLRILNAHEMANDVVGGTPIALAYCTLCGSAIAYIAEIDGQRTTFGTSGLLYRANKLMYDRMTETLWVQFAGRPVIGPLQDDVFRLQTVPLTLTTWAEWRALHPETTVLDINTGVYPEGAYRAENDPQSQYYEYRADGGSIFPLHEWSDLLPEKELVAGVVVGGEAAAYPLTRLEDARVINDMVGGEDIVIVANGSRAYKAGGLTFSLSDADGAIVLRDSDGGKWRLREEALVSEDDPTRTLPRLESQVAYWFAWFQFYPATKVWDD